jgi:hypothetical protein
MVWDPDTGFWGAAQYAQFGQAMFVDPATDSYRAGAAYMEASFQGFADGNVVEGALNAVAAVGKAAEVALDVSQVGKVASKSAALGTKAVSASVDTGGDALRAARAGGQRTQGTRYVGEGEAAVIEKTGRVPNTNAAGDAKKVYYTHDKPLNSSAEAQAAYNLPTTPTHRVTVDTRSARPGSVGPVKGGTGTEVTTDRSLPAKGKPKRLR